MAEEAKWYVIHTYSGYENKVKADLEKTIENRGMGNLIFDIKVPMEEVVEQKGDVKKVVTRKIYPGYVFIKMIMTDESWYVVRNTRGCTGFVGPGSKPVPLSEEEVIAMGVEKKTIKVDFDVGDTIKIIDGPFEGFMGNITEMNMEKEQLTVLVSMFGRETPVTLFFNQVEALNG
ncbi:MAG: transcription termination/antitermination protein NusG [Clostridiaceae bacterium]|nr:transcription termination/antitermination protein NusG [Clostridiaceae bacterium]